MKCTCQSYSGKIRWLRGRVGATRRRHARICALRTDERLKDDIKDIDIDIADAPHCSGDTLGSCLYEDPVESTSNTVLVKSGYVDATQAEFIAAKGGARLPPDLLTLAGEDGLRYTFVQSYLRLHDTRIPDWLLYIPFVRNRLIYDRNFLFKVLVEIVVDAATCTIAEVYKRGDAFSSELPFFGTDLVVGTFVTTTLVMLMAPSVLPGREPLDRNALQRFLARVPSAAFKASDATGGQYTVADRVSCVGMKFLEYSLAGMVCGFVGQSAANWIHDLYYATPAAAGHSIAPPLDTALVTALFMGVSSNLRYQVVFGLERLVDASIAKRIPEAAYIATILIRFVNNVLGSANYIDFLEFFHVQQ